MMVSKRNFLFWGLLFRFHVKCQGCNTIVEFHLPTANRDFEDFLGFLPLAPRMQEGHGPLLVNRNRVALEDHPK